MRIWLSAGLSLSLAVWAIAEQTRGPRAMRRESEVRRQAPLRAGERAAVPRHEETQEGRPRRPAEVRPRAKRPPAAETRPQSSREPSATRPRKPKTKPTPETRSWLVKAERGIVASDSALASEVGADILELGGNAVDAAVATSFALGVTRPGSTGLGGGGFALVHLSRSRETFAIDFRETAPLDARWDMYVRARRKDPNNPSPSRYGGLALGVPGLLAGANHILEKYGTMRLEEVIAPALELAEAGFKADRNYVESCKKAIRDYQRHPEWKLRYDVLYRTLLRRGKAPGVGETLRRPMLARALRAISIAGESAFYDGQISEAIVRTVERAGGILRYDDLLSYRVRRREPVRVRYRDFEVLSMPPPSSGGIVIAEVLNVLEQYDLARIYAEEPPRAVHLFIEACKHGFADRSRWLGDPAFVKIPQRFLTGKKYASVLAKGIEDDKTQPTRSYGITRLRDDAGTSHFSVVDADDNVVAWTETINTNFGSMVMTEPFGIILNNEMDDFAAEPGKPDAFGLRTSERNAVAPAKRPLSSMSPTIVFDRQGLPILALGASGGPRIISSVLNVMVHALDYEMTLGEAVEANRIHHQWLPNEVRFRSPPEPNLVKALRKRGHKIGKRRTTGMVQAIEWRPDYTLLGASDPQKGGKPAGH